MASPQDNSSQDQPPGSRDRLSPPISGAVTPGSRGKKRVGFHVATQENVPPPQVFESSPPPESIDDASRTSSISMGRPPLEDEDWLQGPSSPHSLDQLELTRSLNQLKADSTPTVLKTPSTQAMEEAQFNNLSNRSKGDSTPIILKSALRKGMVSRDNRPQPLDLRDIENISEKVAAADRAQKKATSLERDVYTAPSSPSGSPSRGPSRSSFAFAGKEPNHSPKSHPHGIWSRFKQTPGISTGQNTPNAEELDEYFPEPTQYRAAGLSANLLYDWWNSAGRHSRASSSGGDSVPPSPGTLTPSLHVTPPDNETPPSPGRPRSSRFWQRNPRQPEFGIGNIVSATASSTALAGPDISNEYRKHAGKRPDYKRSSSAGSLADLWSQPRKRKKPPREFDITIKKHIQETETRKRYILKLCRALMEYGAPTHRLEGYLTMTSRVLEIEAQYMYFPGTMIISFDDARTHTAEMKLVRVSQGVDLGKMKDVHNVYKDVSHDLIGVEEGLQRLDAISKKGSLYPTWLRILAFGFGSATVAPFAFQARPIDLPICFFLGCILGYGQLVLAPMSDLYTAVFEIVATIITSFLARAFGSIRGGSLFCFSALAQSSIALILPGFVVLCAALELQSRNLIAGSVRVVYAVIYSFWIGYGLTIGTALYGAIDHNAISKANCENPLSSNSRQYSFLFVPVYTICLCIINNAKWKQWPMMVIISFAGYQVNYWAGNTFKNNAQIASTFGAAAISLLANGYSRLGKKIDMMEARLKQWLSSSSALKKFGIVKEEEAESVKPERRKSSIADSILTLIGARRDSEKEKDVEAPGSSEEDEPKPEHIAETDEAPQQAANSEITMDNSIVTNSKGERIGRDGKPKKINYVLAAAAMLPAIFVQVPSGVSVAGSLVDGIAAANQLTNNTNTMGMTPADGSGGSGVLSANDITSSGGNSLDSSVSFAVASSVVQVAIGITIGLFIGTLLVYPTGKGSSQGRANKNARGGIFAF